MEEVKTLAIVSLLQRRWMAYTKGDHSSAGILQGLGLRKQESVYFSNTDSALQKVYKEYSS